ncbi:MAG: alpha/beta hydrolase, partial [Planctomycetota bacterium]
AIEKKTGKNFKEITWRPYVKEVNMPTLVIQNRNDGYLDEAFVNGVYQDLTVEKQLLWIEIPKKKGGAFPNRAAAYDWLGENPEPILGWFNKYMA